MIEIYVAYPAAGLSNTSTYDAVREMASSFDSVQDEIETLSGRDAGQHKIEDGFLLSQEGRGLMSPFMIQDARRAKE